MCVVHILMFTIFFYECFLSVKTPGRNKGLYGKYDQAVLERAIEDVKSGRMTFGAASKEFAIPKTTLRDHVHGRSQMGKKAGRPTCLPKELEDEIVDKVIQGSKAGFPLTKRQFLLKVGHLAKKRNLQTQFKDNMPSEEYWRCLKRRRPDLTIRSPETCAANRMRGMNPVVVNDYFNSLEEFMARHELHLKPECVWNADETGVQFSPAAAKIIAQRGEKQLLARSANSRDSVTTLVCINAAGRANPPLFVVKGKTFQSVRSFATHDAPEGAVWTFQPNAWMDNVLGVEWFVDVFLKHCGLARPQVLFLDSHGSHEVPELLEKARQENIHLMALPPHTTHFLQPLDRVVFGPFKRFYKRLCTEFMSEHPNNTINKVTWPGIMRKTWEETMKPELLKKAFLATGILPVDRTQIPDQAFLPASALDRVPEDPAPALPDPVLDALPSTSTSLPSTSSATAGPAEDHGEDAAAAAEAQPTTDLLPEDLDQLVTLPITAEDVAGLQGLVIEVEGGDPISLDLHGLGEHPFVPSAPSTSVQIDVDTIFGIKQATKSPANKKTGNRSFPSGHRLLTSDEVFLSKMAQKADKERKEAEKQARKAKAEERKAKAQERKLKAEETKKMKAATMSSSTAPTTSATPTDPIPSLSH